MIFREALYVIDTAKGVDELYGQLRIEGGAVAIIAPNGTLVRAYAPGAWRHIGVAVPE